MPKNTVYEAMKPISICSLIKFPLFHFRRSVLKYHSEKFPCSFNAGDFYFAVRQMARVAPFYNKSEKSLPYLVGEF